VSLRPEAHKNTVLRAVHAHPFSDRDRSVTWALKQAIVVGDDLTLALYISRSLVTGRVSHTAEPRRCRDVVYETRL
jgi:hypothetical protein